MEQQWHQLMEMLTDNPVQVLFLVLGILLLEVILSFDNAAVLATMVKDLPEDQQKKALRYGIVGAYVFRGVALVLVEQILSIWWLKPLGGLYLLWMAFNHFFIKDYFIYIPFLQGLKIYRPAVKVCKLIDQLWGDAFIHHGIV